MNHYDFKIVKEGEKIFLRKRLSEITEYGPVFEGIEITHALENYLEQINPLKIKEFDILERDVKEQMQENAGFWQPCSGCHETVDGYEVSGSFYSRIFECYLGCGCSACGGLGVTWDSTDYEQLYKELEEKEKSQGEI